MANFESSLTESPDLHAWIYVPEAKYKRVEEVFAIQQDEKLEFGHIRESHLGGAPWIIPKGINKKLEEILTSFAGQCPKCNTDEQLTLIAQLYVPLDEVDRVTYILGCNAYNCMYFCARRFSSDTRPADSLKNSDLFSEDTEWGMNEEGLHEKPEKSTGEYQPAMHLDTSRPYLPFTSLIQEREVDLYDDYLRRTRTETEKAIEESLSSHEIASEIDIAKQEEYHDDPILLEYLNYSQIYPNQVARWSPKSKPILVCSTQDVHFFPSTKAESALLKLPEKNQEYGSESFRFLNRVPPCETCGLPRHFELQIFSTAVYLLGSGYGKWYMNDSMASMGTLIVFSCLNPSCGINAYTSEFIAYQGGI